MLNVTINKPEIMDTDSILAITSVCVVSATFMCCVVLIFRTYIIRSCRATRPHSGSDLSDDTMDEDDPLTPLVV